MGEKEMTSVCYSGRYQAVSVLGTNDRAALLAGNQQQVEVYRPGSRGPELRRRAHIRFNNKSSYYCENTDRS
jgi:hypothetical protein